MAITKIVSVSLSDDTRDALDAEAKRQRRSRSWIVREALAEYVAHRRDEAFDASRDRVRCDGLAMTPPQHARLARVCALLNAADVRYAIIGGHAVQLHGLVRATRGVDILIEPTIENAERTLDALRRLPLKVTDGILPEALLSNAVTKMGDSPQVDVLTLASSVRYADARAGLLTTVLEGVTVPYVDIDTLIRSKRTGRLQDLADIEALERIKTLSAE